MVIKIDFYLIHTSLLPFKLVNFVVVDASLRLRNKVKLGLLLPFFSIYHYLASPVQSQNKIIQDLRFIVLVEIYLKEPC